MKIRYSFQERYNKPVEKYNNIYYTDGAADKMNIFCAKKQEKKV